MKVEKTRLSIEGPDKSPLPNRFYRQENGGASHLALILPGLLYTCDKPLLYYPTQLLLWRGADVLQLWRDYSSPDSASASREEQAGSLMSDCQALLEAGRSQKDYAGYILVGKSLGTIGLAYLLSQLAGETVAAIWLTPLLQQPRLVQAAANAPAPGLFIAGSGDPNYDAQAMARIRQATGAESLIIQGADHSMEIPGDMTRSLFVMQKIMQGVADFLDSCLPEV
jgi:dienelactone hydrolase